MPYGTAVALGSIAVLVIPRTQMNNMRKLFIGVLVSVVVATLCVFIVYRKIQTGNNDGQDLPRVALCRTTRDIATGERLPPTC